MPRRYLRHRQPWPGRSIVALPLAPLSPYASKRWRGLQYGLRVSVAWLATPFLNGWGDAKSRPIPLLSRFAPFVGLVASRQTFVHRSQHSVECLLLGGETNSGRLARLILLSGASLRAGTFRENVEAAVNVYWLSQACGCTQHVYSD